MNKWKCKRWSNNMVRTAFHNQSARHRIGEKISSDANACSFYKKVENVFLYLKRSAPPSSSPSLVAVLEIFSWQLAVLYVNLFRILQCKIVTNSMIIHPIPPITDCLPHFEIRLPLSQLPVKASAIATCSAGKGIDRILCLFELAPSKQSMNYVVCFELFRFESV